MKLFDRLRGSGQPQPRLELERVAGDVFHRLTQMHGAFTLRRVLAAECLQLFKEKSADGGVGRDEGICSGWGTGNGLYAVYERICVDGAAEEDR